jgi:hypothetical protein
MPSLKLTLKKDRTQIRWVSQLMKPERREWDEQMIKACLYLHDAYEVLRIRLTERGDNDFIAWHYERTGLFMLQSAYKPALESEQMEKRQTESSAVPDGSCDVPSLSKVGQSYPRSLWGVITEVMTHNMSHIRFKHMKCFESWTLL